MARMKVAEKAINPAYMCPPQALSMDGAMTGWLYWMAIYERDTNIKPFMNMDGMDG